MFPKTWFPPSYFEGHYWPKTGAPLPAGGGRGRFFFNIRMLHMMVDQQSREGRLRREAKDRLARLGVKITMGKILAEMEAQHLTNLAESASYAVLLSEM